MDSIRIPPDELKSVAASIGFGYTLHKPTKAWMQQNQLASYRDYVAYMKKREFPSKDTIITEIEHMWCVW
jgi:hypothetical protein